MKLVTLFVLKDKNAFFLTKPESYKIVFTLDNFFCQHVYKFFKNIFFNKDKRIINNLTEHISTYSKIIYNL